MKFSAVRVPRGATRAAVVCLALLAAGCSSSTVTATAPATRTAPGIWYVVNEANPGVIVYEGGYAVAQRWMLTHQGQFQSSPLNSPLSPGHKRCNPAKTTCLVP